MSEALLAELERALAYPKLRRHIAREDGAAFIEILRSTASIFADAEHPDQVSGDPGDDYLVALAIASASILVSGDTDLLVRASELPIQPPSKFLMRLRTVGHFDPIVQPGRNAGKNWANICSACRWSQDLQH